MSFRGVKRRGNPLNRNATQWRLPLTHLFSQSLPRRKSLLSVRTWIQTPAAISQDCLLGEAHYVRKRRIQTALRLWQPTRMSFRGVKRRGNPLNRNATQWRLPSTALVLAITTAQKIFAISSSRGKTPATIPQDSLLGEVRLWRKLNIPQSKQCFDIIAHSAISSCKA